MSEHTDEWWQEQWLRFANHGWHDSCRELKVLFRTALDERNEWKARAEQVERALAELRRVLGDNQ